jgi:KaiC/GvpD/RAD55 family RecA-like ATPase
LVDIKGFSSEPMMDNIFLPSGVHPVLKGKPFFPANRDKRPAVLEWRPFADRLPTIEEATAWVNHKGPWAMPCGPLSFVAVDFDGADGKKLYEDRFGNGTSLPPTAMTPSGGYHAFFVYPKDEEIVRLLKNAVRILPGVDIRTHGGYVIIPTETTPDRCWLQPPDIPAPPLPDWIIEALRKKPEAPMEVISSAEPDGLPTGVGKGQRNSTAARLAGRYLAKGLSAEETALILVDWNRRKNSPPLPEEEIRRTVFSIAKREREKSVSLEVVPAADLISSPSASRQLLISPFFPAGGKGILAGNSGVGKTMLAENIAYTIADGKSLFTRFDVTRGNVIYVDSESPPHLTRARAERIARGLQAPHRGVSFIFPEKRLDLGVARNREEICRAIEKQKAGLVILDSFLCFASLRSENDNAEVREWLERLSDIPKATGAALLLLDHAAKASPDRAKAGIPLSARGAGAKHDWADVVMTFEERKNELRFLRALRFPKTRFCSPVPALILEMDRNFIFTPSGEDEACPIYLVRQIVEENPGIAATKLYQLLMAATGCSRPTADKAARKAAELGYVIREERGKYVNYYPKADLPNVLDFGGREG